MKQLFVGVIAVLSLVASANSKMFVAVEKFENKANAPDAYFTTLRARITDDIINTRKFEVLERERIKSVLSEQSLKEAGVTGADGSGPESGKMKSAGYVIYGSVLSLGKDSTRVSGDVAAGKMTAKVEIQLRLANAENGKIVSSKTIVATKSQARMAGAGVSTSGNVSEQALTDALREASKKVTEALMELAFPVKILTVSAASAKANLTREQTEEGALYNVFALGEELIDPDTNESLGADEELVGCMRVSRVAPKFATLVPVGDLDMASVKKGMLLRRVSDEELQKAKQKEKAQRASRFESRF